MRTNKRAGVALVKNNRLFLIKRQKDTEIYYILPGGGVELKETPEDAAIREIREELRVDIKLNKKIAEFEHRGNIEYYYLSENYKGKIKFVGDSMFNSNIIDKEEWVLLNNIHKINLLPEKIKIILVNLFINNRSSENISNKN